YYIFLFTYSTPPSIYTLSLHDALPICVRLRIEIDEEHAFSGLGQARSQVDGGRRLADAALLVRERVDRAGHRRSVERGRAASARDRKSTRLNSSHDQISYAVFCLKKKK